MGLPAGHLTPDQHTHRAALTSMGLCIEGSTEPQKQLSPVRAFLGVRQVHEVVSMCANVPVKIDAPEEPLLTAGHRIDR
jgi:hypothetical protein